jgi:hypothetical protein
MYEMYIIILFQMSYWDSTELEGEVYCLTVEEIIEDINEGTLICLCYKLHMPLNRSVRALNCFIKYFKFKFEIIYHTNKHDELTNEYI